MNAAIVYAAVRTTEGERWIDISSVSASADVAKDNANAMDREIPQWAKVNPCVEITECRLIAIPARA